MKMTIVNKNGSAEIHIVSSKDLVVYDQPHLLSILQYACGDRINGKQAVVVVHPFSGIYLTFECEGVDSWRHAIYAMSEGEIHIDGNSKNVYGQRFIACNLEDLASYLMTMASEYAKTLGLSFGYEFTQSPFYRNEALKRLVPATEEQERDPSIKWTMEGSSKYGRRMVNYELGIWRSLTISEFYGGGVVD